METQKTPIAKAVFRKKNGAGGINLLDFRLYYKYRPMEQDRKPRNKPMHLWVPYFFTKEARIYNGGKDSLFNK